MAAETLPIKTKDPDARLDFGIVWSEWLMTGESITALDVDLGSTDLTLESSGFGAVTIDQNGTEVAYPAGQVSQSWISGGQPGHKYTIRHRITTDSTPLGRIDDRSFILHIAER